MRGGVFCCASKLHSFPCDKRFASHAFKTQFDHHARESQEGEDKERLLQRVPLLGAGLHLRSLLCPHCRPRHPYRILCHHGQDDWHGHRQGPRGMGTKVHRQLILRKIKCKVVKLLLYHYRLKKSGNETIGHMTVDDVAGT
jgi:hypothetical protein